MKHQLVDMRRSSPDDYHKVIKMLKGEGGPRTHDQRGAVVNFVQQLVKSNTKAKKQGYKMLPQRAFMARMKYQEGYSKDSAKRKWKRLEANPKTYREKKGKTLFLAVKDFDEYNETDTIGTTSMFDAGPQQIAKRDIKDVLKTDTDMMLSSSAQSRHIRGVECLDHANADGSTESENESAASSGSKSSGDSSVLEVSKSSRPDGGTPAVKVGDRLTALWSPLPKKRPSSGNSPPRSRRRRFDDDRNSLSPRRRLVGKSAGSKGDISEEAESSRVTNGPMAFVRERLSYHESVKICLDIFQVTKCVG